MQAYHDLDVRRQHEDPFIADGSGVRFGILQHPFEPDLTHIGTFERHGESGLAAQI